MEERCIDIAKAPGSVPGRGTIFGVFIMSAMMSVHNIARIAHEVNRAFCEATGDDSQVSWDEAPDWQKDSSMAGVLGVISGDITTPEEAHRSWTNQKINEGWTYGLVKDPEAKTHPCLVEYAALPEEQRVKDSLFFAVVTSYLKGIEDQ